MNDLNEKLRDIREAIETLKQCLDRLRTQQGRCDEWRRMADRAAAALDRLDRIAWELEWAPQREGR